MGKKSYVIVVGNEKGGSGKSTISMHLAVFYLYAGYKVATIDLDGRQGTITHYIKNRVRWSADHKIEIPVPEHLVVTPSQYSSRRSSVDDERQLDGEIAAMRGDYDIVIIDTPGTYNHLSNAGHKNADILITPINDSLIDIDVIAAIDPYSKDFVAESQYAANIRRIGRIRAKAGDDPFQWFVLRNRISHTESKNKQEVDMILRSLEGRIGFTYLPGLGERVVYRELFLRGLTMFDLLNHRLDEISVSHVAAKNELMMILRALGIPLVPGMDAAQFAPPPEFQAP
jgi:chromosome partitioning protein